MVASWEEHRGGCHVEEDLARVRRIQRRVRYLPGFELHVGLGFASYRIHDVAFVQRYERRRDRTVYWLHRHFVRVRVGVPLLPVPMQARYHLPFHRVPCAGICGAVRDGIRAERGAAEPFGVSCRSGVVAVLRDVAAAVRRTRVRTMQRAGSSSDPHCRRCSTLS